MYREFYAHGAVDSALFGLMVFVGIFAAVLAWIYVPRRGRPTFDDVSRLPLLDSAPPLHLTTALHEEDRHA